MIHANDYINHSKDICMLKKSDEYSNSIIWNIEKFAETEKLIHKYFKKKWNLNIFKWYDPIERSGGLWIVEFAIVVVVVSNVENLWSFGGCKGWGMVPLLGRIVRVRIGVVIMVIVSDVESFWISVDCEG